MTNQHSDNGQETLWDLTTGDVSKVSTWAQTRGSGSDRAKLINSQTKDFKESLRAFEASRYDALLTMGDLKPITVRGQDDKGKLVDQIHYVVYQPEGVSEPHPFHFSTNAWRQWFQSRGGQTISHAYWNSIQGYRNKQFELADGSKTSLRHEVFAEVLRTQQRGDTSKKRFFRVAKTGFMSGVGNSPEHVVGIVNKVFPTFYSDHKMIDAIDNTLNDAGIDASYGRFSKFDTGRVSLKWVFNEKDLVLQMAESAKDFRASRGALMGRDRGMKAGMGYHNSFAGNGSLWFENYYFREICTNGVGIGSSPALGNRVNHYNDLDFIKKIRSQILTVNKGLEKFADGVTYDLVFPKTLTADQYLANREGQNQLYRDMSRAIVLRVLMVSNKLGKNYTRAGETILADWKNEMVAIAAQQKWNKEKLSKLMSVGINDPTIKLSEDITATDYASVVDIFTSAANWYYEKGSLDMSQEMQEIGASLLHRTKPLTPVITVPA